MTAAQIIAELTSKTESVLYHDISDTGTFSKPRPFGWRPIFLTFIWSIPVWLVFYYFEAIDQSHFWSATAAGFLLTVFFDWRNYRNIASDENFRNLIITDRRVIQINWILNFNGSLRIRYINPSNFTAVEDKFAKGIWWAAAASKDSEKSILIAHRKTEKVKALIRQQFLTPLAQG